MAEPPVTGDGRIKGRLIAVPGSVLDVRFPAGALPGIDEGLEIERDGNDPLVAEVRQHLDPVTVRAASAVRSACRSATLCWGDFLTQSASPPISDRRCRPTRQDSLKRKRL
jgi:hypothetical protein